MPRPSAGLSSLCWLLLLVARAWGQATTGSVSGTVLESWDAKPLPGVTVTVRGTTLATTTDVAGQYRIDQVPLGDQTLRFSRPGYASAVVSDVRVLSGQVTRVDGVLRPEFYEMEEYVVRAEEFREQAVELLAERQDAAALLDAIGAAQFARVAASDAADIVSRVPGITVSEGKNPVVRGLNERYVGVTLNGAEVPSADPYRKSAQLDLFPAGLIREVTVAKSFTPDLPGNFTGGGVNIITRPFPEKFLFNASGTLEYNSRTTGRSDLPTYSGGALDWAGMDDGTRALPDEFNPPVPPVPSRVSTSGRPTSPTYDARVAQANLLDQYTKRLGSTEFAPTPSTAPPNYSGGFSLGDTVQLAGRDFGYFGGLNYQQKYQYLEGVSRRYVPGLGQTLQRRKDFEDVAGASEVNWSAVANTAFRFSPDHELSFNFLYNQNAEDVARTQTGTISDDPEYIYYLDRLHWIERNLTTFQLKGAHEFPSLHGLRVDWLGALSSTTQDEPNARFFNYRSDGTTYEPDHASLPTPNKPTRYYRELEEGNGNVKLDITLPFSQWRGLDSTLKAGAYYSQSQRDFVDREMYYEGLYGRNDAYPFAGDPNAFLPPGSLGYTSRTNTNGSISYTWNRNIQSRQSTYNGAQTLWAGYAMTELPLLERLTFIGGMRYETTALAIDSASYLPNGNTGRTENSSRLDQTDPLPALGLVYQIRKDMNLRAGFSQTLARPTFRELAAYRSYDPITDEIVEGNPNLAMTSILNYDLRWEWFPRPGEVLAASVFYKRLSDAIERRFLTISGDIISFINREEAEVYGVELEARRSLGFLSETLDRFSLGFNAALIQSDVPLTPQEIANRTQFVGDTSASRPLYDQSDYIVNVDLGFDNEPTGTSATLAFNVFGPRIVIAGLSTPDIYEQPVPELDFIVTQKLGKHWKLRFSAKNLLDPDHERTYGKSSSILYSSAPRGRVFGLQLAYEY